jgi:hypothetical protein
MGYKIRSWLWIAIEFNITASGSVNNNRISPSKAPCINFSLSSIDMVHARADIVKENDLVASKSIDDGGGDDGRDGSKSRYLRAQRLIGPGLSRDHVILPLIHLVTSVQIRATALSKSLFPQSTFE